MNNIIDNHERVPNTSATIKKTKLTVWKGKSNQWQNKEYGALKMSDVHYVHSFSTKPKFTSQCIWVCQYEQAILGSGSVVFVGNIIHNE